jgi:hypothetical protein
MPATLALTGERVEAFGDLITVIVVTDSPRIERMTIKSAKSQPAYWLTPEWSLRLVEALTLSSPA